MGRVPDEVVSLVERFDRNRDAYKSPSYNETQVRREFIDPFFKALGWDVDNEQGHAEAYKDVIHEDAIKIGGATKAPDYCFRIGGTRKFFLEAKKPAVPLKDSAESAYQLRRYAWSAKLPLSILTDFEELCVYDCRIRPHKADKPTKARTMYFTYDQYLERWDELASIFSRDAILKGSFDKYAESASRKKGTAEVDVEFLREIEGWRDLLAGNFALRNPGLSVRDLNFAVQRTIDRIIFLRMCEDRGIEPYGQLLALCATRTEPQASARGQPAAPQASARGSSRPVADAPGSDLGRLYQRLGELFRRADERYNSSLFYFTAEAGREPPDELTLSLRLDDRLLKQTLTGLYYPESPYEFSVLAPEILGQVYEQFLGKVIRLTKAHRAKVEEKPEVRKAGGVYYTPTYIVDYIVKHTVGKLLEGKTPADVGPDVASAPRGRRSAAAGRRTGRGRRGATGGLPASARRRPLPHGRGSVRPLRILDPACGSGSFLLGAYRYLLDWHRDWYVKDMQGSVGVSPAETGSAGVSPANQGSAGVSPAAAHRHPDRIYQAAGGQWRLTVQEKKRILLNHIYGVDIDPQAVEVTKLSLLLKVLEGETAETIGSTLRLFHERALPDLSDNIKCGNSLIGPDFYEGRQLSMFDEEERLRINAFDWHAEFPDVFVASGPRTGRLGQNRARQGAAQPNRARKEAEQNRERERAAQRSGAPAGSPAATRRKPLPDGRGSDQQPGPDTGFDAVIGNPPYLFITEVPADQRRFFESTYDAVSYRFDLYGAFVERATRLWLRAGGTFGFIIPHTLLSNDSFQALRGILAQEATVYHVVDFGPGVFHTVRNETMLLFFAAGLADAQACIDVMRTTPKVFPGHLVRFEVAHAEWVRPDGAPWLVHVTPDLARVIRRMQACEERLGGLCTINQGLRTGDNTRYLARAPKGPKWKPAVGGKHVSRYRQLRSDLFVYYEPSVLDAPRKEHLFTSRGKIVVQEVRNIALPRRIVATFDAAQTFCLQSTNVINVRATCPYNLLYLLGVVNSELVNLFFRVRFPGNNHIASNQLAQIPVPPCDRHQHDRLVSLVQQMLDLHKQLSAAKTPPENTALQRQIDGTDRQIDQLVYELYELTDEEIRIVEEATR